VGHTYAGTGACDWPGLVHDVSLPHVWRLDPEGETYQCREKEIVGTGKKMAQTITESLADDYSLFRYNFLFRVFYGQTIGNVLPLNCNNRFCNNLGNGL